MRVDDKERDLGIKGDLTRHTGPVRLRLDVTGAKTLMLAVDFGAAATSAIASTGPTPAWSGGNDQ